MTRIVLAVAFVMLALVVQAGATERFGAWQVGVDGDGHAYAGTELPTGQLLSQYCGAAGCLWILGGRSSCQMGTRYPVLANALTASTTFQVQCGGEAVGLHGYFFVDYDAIDRFIRAHATPGGVVGFAMPLADGAFRVLRFDLTGAAAAFGRLAEVYTQQRDRTRPRARPTDERL